MIKLLVCQVAVTFATWRDVLADWLGVAMSFDGDLMAPDGSEPWWPNPVGDGKHRTEAERSG